MVGSLGIEPNFAALQAAAMTTFANFPFEIDPAIILRRPGLVYL
jgi:hypothetical protein